MYGGIRSLGADIHKAGPRERRLRGFLGREESCRYQRQHGASITPHRSPNEIATYSAAVWESSEARDCWEKLLLRPVARSVFVSAADNDSDSIVGGGGGLSDMVSMQTKDQLMKRRDG